MKRASMGTWMPFLYILVGVELCIDTLVYDIVRVVESE